MVFYRAVLPVVVEYWVAGLTWAYGVGMIGTRVCRAGLPVAGDRAVLVSSAMSMGPVGADNVVTAVDLGFSLPDHGG
jgi:hypothetical protein